MNKDKDKDSDLKSTDKNYGQLHIEALKDIHHLLSERLVSRNPLDATVQISSTMPYVVDYKERKHAFVWSAVVLTLSVEDGGSFAVPAGVWTQLDFPRGYRIFATNIASNAPIYVFIKCTDELINANGGGEVTIANTTTALFTTAQVGVASGQSTDLQVASFHEVSIDINITVVGTSIQFFYERKGADGIYYPIWQSQLFTATGSVSTSVGPGLAFNQSLGFIDRLRWVVVGAVATFTPNIYAK